MSAQVHVRLPDGKFAHPEGAILKEGPGCPFFYADGEFRVSVHRGKVELVVERGTEYVPLTKTVECPKNGIVEVALPLRRWTDLPDSGWYPGNTHVHYSGKEVRPDERLRMDPRVHDLRLTVISILQRRDMAYASNRYPIGLLNDFSTAHHLVDCGEESRHNSEPWEIGYGHIMLIRLANQVDPVSRGTLVDDLDPDYPPLSYACDDARRQGAFVIWCHNGQGMEAPVAAVLGKLDAFNLFDPYWADPEYDIWYDLLNCGIRLPASTGSDWFVCSNNRVYVETGSTFDYDNWLMQLRAGRSFITNGPALHLRIDDQNPGATLQLSPGDQIDVCVSWLSHYPLHRVDVVQNGRIVHARAIPQGSMAGEERTRLHIDGNSWIAARCASEARDSYFHPLFAHTSPVYVRTGKTARSQKEAAIRFLASLDESMEWIRARGRFQHENQRKEVLDLFRRAQEAYRSLARGEVIAPGPEAHRT